MEGYCRGALVLGSGCRACRRCFDELMALAVRFTDPDPCQYDHHGYCQAHSLHERPCPHQEMQWIMAHYNKKE